MIEKNDEHEHPNQEFVEENDRMLEDMQEPGYASRLKEVFGKGLGKTVVEHRKTIDSEKGAYYRDRAAKFRKRKILPLDDDSSDNRLFS
jgi:hypothetical protein